MKCRLMNADMLLKCRLMNADMLLKCRLMNADMLLKCRLMNADMLLKCRLMNADILKQNEAQSTCAESTNKGFNSRVKYMTRTQQRPESPTVTLTWHTGISVLYATWHTGSSVIYATGGHPLLIMYFY